MRLRSPIPHISIYSNIGDVRYTDAAIEAAYHTFPDSVKHKIATYQLPDDRRIRSISKMLLLEALGDVDTSKPLSLNDLQYDSSNKPHIHPALHLSIAHSAQVAVCAWSEVTEIGIDIELIREIALTDYKDYLSAREFDFLLNSKNSTNDFFQLWTRKEALAKLLGTGIETKFQEIDVLNDTLTHDGNEYACIRLDIHPSYCCSLVYRIVGNIIVE